MSTRSRVELIAKIVSGKISRREAASRYRVSLAELFEWENEIRRANRDCLLGSEAAAE